MPILELDVSEARLAVATLDDQIALKRNEQMRTRLELESTLADLERRQEIKSLEARSLQYEATKSHTLCERGLIANDAVRKADTDAERATIELRLLADAMEVARRSHAARDEGLELEMKILTKQRDEAAHVLQLATPAADRPGVLTWVMTSEGAAVRRGDQIARIADLSSFRVDATVSDVHAGRLAAGMPASVQIGEARLQGTISTVHPAVQDGAIRFDVVLQNPSDSRLRPNLRVDVHAITASKPAALRVPRGTFAGTDGSTWAFRPARRSRRAHSDSSRPRRFRDVRSHRRTSRRRRSHRLGHVRLHASPGGHGSMSTQQPGMRPEFDSAAATATVAVPGTPRPAAMVALAGVEKVYRTQRIETVALSNVNVEVGTGEFISIMGPSGSGKSTLLHIIGLLDVPTKGSVALGGEPVSEWGDTRLAQLRNRQIGFVFQTFHLIADLDVLDNVELPLIYRNLSASSRRELAKAAVERVGLSARMHHFPSQLSGGQQQRVAIARAIVGNPRLLLADEPTGNLDSRMGEEIMDILHRLNREAGTTIVMVTHDQRWADSTGRILRLFDGRQVA
jgi:putative ABC transport system ATP-binding protein